MAKYVRVFINCLVANKFFKNETPKGNEKRDQHPC